MRARELAAGLLTSYGTAWIREVWAGRHARTDKTSEPKGVYRVRNWSGYNAALIPQGDGTIWIDESALINVDGSGASKRGRAA